MTNSTTLPRPYDEGSVATYTSGSGAVSFGWTDAAHDSPDELAAKFLNRFSSLCVEGEGVDEPYARWYSAMLRATEPAGVIYAFADWSTPDDSLEVARFPGDLKIPLPPPGEAQG